MGRTAEELGLLSGYLGLFSGYLGLFGGEKKATKS
jgi:hypothetical protein